VRRNFPDYGGTADGADSDASKADPARPPTSTGGPNGNGPDQNAPIVIDDDDEPGPAGGAGQAGKAAASAEPRKQSIWTQDMKDTFGQLLDNYQDMVDLNKRLGYVDRPVHKSRKLKSQGVEDPKSTF
jgi:hypothetical protein